MRCAPGRDRHLEAKDPSTDVTATSTASAVGFTSVSTGGGPGGVANRLGTVDGRRGVYQAKSEPSPKPVVCQTAATTGASAVDDRRVLAGRQPAELDLGGMPAASGTVLRRDGGLARPTGGSR